MAKAQARNNDENGNNPDAFKKAAKNVGVNAWKKARTEAPQQRVGVRIPMGRYEAKLTKMVCGEQDYTKSIGKGKTQVIKVPSVRFNFVITSGEQKGVNVAKFIRLRPEDVEWSELDYKDLSESLQNLGYETADESFRDLSPIPDIAEEVTKNQPDVFIYAGKVKTYKKKDGSDGDSQNISINGLNQEAPPAETEETEEEESEEVDLDTLATSADDDSDEDAQTKLTEIAETYDIDPNNLDTWADVAEAIKEAQEGATEEAEEEEAEEEEADEVVPVKPAKKKVAKQPVKKPLKKGRK